LWQQILEPAACALPKKAVSPFFGVVLAAVAAFRYFTVCEMALAHLKLPETLLQPASKT